MKKRTDILFLIVMGPVIGLWTWTLKEVVSLKVQVAELTVKVSALEKSPQIIKRK